MLWDENLCLSLARIFCNSGEIKVDLWRADGDIGILCPSQCKWFLFKAMQIFCFSLGRYNWFLVWERIIQTFYFFPEKLHFSAWNIAILPSYASVSEFISATWLPITYLFFRCSFEGVFISMSFFNKLNKIINPFALKKIKILLFWILSFKSFYPLQTKGNQILQTLNFIMDAHKCSTWFSQKILEGIIIMLHFADVENEAQIFLATTLGLRFPKQAWSPASRKHAPRLTANFQPHPSPTQSESGSGREDSSLCFIKLSR